MVPLHQVDLSDQTFSVNFLPDLKRLRASIREMGLIQPVLLKMKTNKYQIVSGFRRISVALELGYGEIESRIFGEEMEDLKLFFISLHENLTSRGFNAVEKAIALEKMTDHFKVDPAFITRELLSLFDLETNEKILKTFLSLARMEEGVKSYIVREEVSRSNIRRLAAWSAEDRQAVMVLLTSLRLGENSLREMLTLIEEIGKRDRCGVESIVALPEIQDTLSHPELTSTQKTERVKKILTGLRYPRMSHLEAEFERDRRDLNLPPGVSLSHPPFFEGKGLRIGFQFQSVEEYRSILSSLSSLGENEEFRAMIDPPSSPSPRKGDGDTGLR
jgi:ParB family chromosome partitioning protein